MDTTGLILLAAHAAVLLAVAGLFLYGDLAGRRRLRRLTSQVATAEEPTVLATFSGQIILANPVFQGLVSQCDPPCDVAALLRNVLIRVGEAEVYRLSQIARASGFAVLPTERSDTGELCHLTVTAAWDDRLVWRVLGADAAVELVPKFDSTPYEAAPFVHLGPNGKPNAQFRELFGTNPEPVLATLREGDFKDGERVLLTGRDGRVYRFSAYSFSPGEAGASEQPDSSPDADHFLIPVGVDTASETRSWDVLERVPVALAQFDQDGALLWCNALARQILGGQAEIGRNMEAMFAPLGQPLRVVSRDRTGHHPMRGQMAQLRGSDTFLQIALKSARIDGHETTLAVLTDASQLRQLEDQFAQSQKMEAVGKLAGGVAHDFNNVLTAIVGHCDLLLLRKDASHPDYSDLIQITQNANRAAALVRQLLAFSRKQTLNPEVLSVQDVVSETHYLLNRLLGESVALQLEMGQDLWSVRADHQQLEQVLMNLVVNARDAMAGSGTVTVSVRNVTLKADTALPEAQRPEGDFVQILVRDTGPGIDPAVLDKVFDPFFTTKPKGEGTGLGLSTVYGIVKQSGGFIFAGNAEDGGACFRILLPRAAAVEALPAPVVATNTVGRRDLTGKGSVLLVEDEDPVRAFAARALKLRGYEVAEAATAEEAMEILEDEDYSVDLLVSDVVMPGMDGPTFATIARQMRPGLRLIFVSGYAEESFRKNLVETDFMFLAKPFSLNELTGKVKEALGDVPAT
ncbi:MAG: ATP-binding protein [Pseudomonadota bacterium]